MSLIKSPPFLFVLAILLTGCAFLSVSPQQNQKASPIERTLTPSAPISISSPVSTRVYIPPTTTTFPPTIEPPQESYLLALLQSEHCKLPCYLGITPGKTSWDEAQTILSKIGAHLEGEHQLNGLGFLDYGYSIWIGDPTMMGITRTRNMGVGDMEIYQSLGFAIGNSKVQGITVYIQTIKFPLKFGEYWSRYSIQNIFNEFGPPDLVSFGITKQSGGYVEDIVYSKLGIVIETNGVREENKICPIELMNSKGAVVNLTLTLTNLNFPLGIYQFLGVPPTDRTVYLPIQESLGIMPSQYYRNVIANPAGCFQIKQTNP